VEDLIGILVGLGAIVAVVTITRRQEAQTAARAAALRDKADDLSLGDVLKVGGVAAATYVGGPKAGSAVGGLLR
jgi:hypothetical protein